MPHRCGLGLDWLPLTDIVTILPVVQICSTGSDVEFMCRWDALTAKIYADFLKLAVKIQLACLTVVIATR